MTTLHTFIEQARADRPVYISAVRDAFDREGTRPFHMHVRLYDDQVRRFALKVPACQDAAEAAFVTDYLNASLYNVLSSLGARRIDLYIDSQDPGMADYVAALPETFQVDRSLRERSGYGKCLNVNQRTLRSLCGPRAHFGFYAHDLSEEPPVDAEAAKPLGGAVFAQLPRRAERGLLMGMDIGGTDVKLAVSCDGSLCAFKEYDWNPAASELAEGLIDPLIMLTRLMRAAACMQAEGYGDEIPAHAFDKSASDEEVVAAIESMEARLGDRLRGLDGIGLCFPDVVIRNRIVGGETLKTRGMRQNPQVDYEEAFAKITGLCDILRDYVREGAPVMNTNDGPMAAFTTAVEQAQVGRDLSEGFFAHTLGTELGTGWILGDGSIPEIPLEVYNCIIDLGSYGQRDRHEDDVRSVKNFNTGLSGTLQKYTSQYGVFRLAAKVLPEAEPAVWQGALERGLLAHRDDRLVVPTAPRDMRKSCLEYFMAAAEDRDSRAAEIFREIGECLAVTWRETQYILEPACRARTLFGRLVKTQTCFELMCEGARRIVDDMALEVADETLANTLLMKQLAAHPVYTVAQFAQAVGAIYYACVGL